MKPLEWINNRARELKDEKGITWNQAISIASNEYRSQNDLKETLPGVVSLDGSSLDFDSVDYTSAIFDLTDNLTFLLDKGTSVIGRAKRARTFYSNHVYTVNENDIVFEDLAGEHIKGVIGFLK